MAVSARAKLLQLCAEAVTASGMPALSKFFTQSWGMTKSSFSEPNPSLPSNNFLCWNLKKMGGEMRIVGLNLIMLSQTASSPQLTPSLALVKPCPWRRLWLCPGLPNSQNPSHLHHWLELQWHIAGLHRRSNYQWQNTKIEPKVKHCKEAFH